MNIPIDYIQSVVDGIPYGADGEWRFRAPEGPAFTSECRPTDARLCALKPLWIALGRRRELCWEFGTTIFRAANPTTS